MQFRLRTIAVILLCLATFAAGALGFTSGMVLCRDAHGCMAVEVAHDSHQVCHADEARHPDEQPGQGHRDEACSDFELAAQRPERAAGDAFRFFAPNLIASALVLHDADLDLPAPRASLANVGAEPGGVRADLIALGAIVLLV